MRRVLGVRPVAEAVCRVRVEITASLPALGSPAGNTLNNASWHLTVAGPAGTSPASTDSLAVGALSTPDAFTISSPNPAAGPPNSAVTLSCSTCTNTFDGVNSVKFNGTAATVVSVSADGKTINTQVPAGRRAAR